MRSQLDLGDRGILVLSVTQNSPAAKAGVEKHDILIFADDKTLQDKKNLEEVVKLAGEEKQSFSLGLIRKGKELTMDIAPIEKSKLRHNGIVFQARNIKGAPPLNLEMGFQKNLIFGNIDEDMRKEMLQHMQRIEQAAEQFNNLNQGFDLRDKK